LEAVPSASVLNLELLASPLAWWLPGLERILGELDLPRWAARRVFGDALLVADAPSLGLRDLPPDQSGWIAASVREARLGAPSLGALPPRRRAAGRRRPEVIVSLGGGPARQLAEVVAACAAVDADLVVVAAQPSDELSRAARALRRAGRRVTL